MCDRCADHWRDHQSAVAMHAIPESYSDSVTRQSTAIQSISDLVRRCVGQSLYIAPRSAQILCDVSRLLVLRSAKNRRHVVAAISEATRNACLGVLSTRTKILRITPRMCPRFSH